MFSKSELLEACEAAEKSPSASEMLQILGEMLAGVSPDQCPSDAREEWLDLHLMIQPRPQVVQKPDWLTRLRQWMPKLSLGTPAPAYALARVRA